jgi:ATP-dependent DNA helicase RecG
MPVTTPLLRPDSPVTDLPRVTSTDRARLEKLGIRTVRDLLFDLPYGWESFGGATPMSQLRAGDQATVVGTLQSIRGRPSRGPRKIHLTEAALVDDEGETLRVVWFNAPFLVKQVHVGDRLAVAGTVTGSRFRFSMRHPHHELVRGDGPRQIGGMMPKYHLVGGLTQRKMASLVEAALPAADQLEDVIPPEVRRRHGLLGVAEAIRQGHKPETDAEYGEARRRMMWAEILELQVAFLLARKAREQERAEPVPYRQEVIDAFKGGLSFELTHAQKRSIWEIYQDIQKPVPMNRLLNGDVGSGKTAVAAAAVAMTHAAEMQSVVMAPTDILARQHLLKFRSYLEDTYPDLKVELLVSAMPASERRRVRTAAASGYDHCSLLVGTHALIEDDVELANLGLAVVDEQHRFGTRQREQLRRKAGRGHPHFLAMTATPIPRTLALALYGDMAVSTIDELPPGRTPIGTEVIAPSERERAYDLVRREVAAGRQAFVICPLIEESEAVEAKAATKEFERLRTEVFPDLRMSLVHGRVKDKDEVMRAFRDGESDILVATAVIEVGVDVPNATVMLIEGAERFGLAQLHQFRGRVGRGSRRSYCLLVPDEATPRLELLAGTTDGFELARADMNMRGTGELLGTRQHGMADVAMDALLRPHLLSEIREEAEAMVEADPTLEGNPPLRLRAERRLEQTSIS